MDKYEYNLKLEEIDKLVDQGAYEEAAEVADAVDWRRVRNVRTLCLISEIYEAAGRLEDSKQILERAYKKSPVGKNVLYRLVEVTTALHQYDEAMEYYSDYVQVAPHDDNKYILKYKIYRGRGSSIEDQIEILEEYLGQEYTERWAYELAQLYRQAGQMQKCLAACDDLVLWFHSGKYVQKALELKKKYAALTPKQQQIYEDCLQEEAREKQLESQPEPEAEDNVVVNMEGIDGDVMAEKIMAETEKEIAEQVTARKAEIEEHQKSQGVVQPEVSATKRVDTEDIRRASAALAAGAQAVPNGMQAEAKHSAEGPTDVDEQNGQHAAGRDSDAPSERPVSGSASAAETAAHRENTAPEEEGKNTAAAGAAVPPAGEASRSAETPIFDKEKFQRDIARDMQKIVSSVARKTEIPDEDLPASVENRIQMTQKVEAPKVQTQTAGRLSIDDILLSMGDKGKEIAKQAEQAKQKKEEQLRQELAEKAEQLRQEQRVRDEELAEEARREEERMQEQRRQEEARRQEQQRIAEEEERQREEEERLATTPKTTMSDVVQEELTDAQKEALQYTSNPEKLLRNRRALPTYEEEPEAPGNTIRMPEQEELMEAARQELMAEEKIRLPKEQAEKKLPGAKEEQRPARRGRFGSRYSEKAAGDADGRQTSDLEEQELPVEAEAAKQNAQQQILEPSAILDEKKAEQTKADKGRAQAEAACVAEADDDASDDLYGEDTGYEELDMEYEAGEDADSSCPEEDDFERRDAASEEIGSEENDNSGENGEYESETDAAYEESDYAEGDYEDAPYEEGDYLTIPDHLRSLFAGFTQIPELEDQIANAIIQAEAKGNDRTSKTGNILIFGAHGSGKTTLAMNLAKAIAQDRGSQVVKMAKIYAADLNKKDIASTVAKIAGGTLIIEEAGDLDDNTIEQLTTAMEFRTDGLIVILEDEQKYVHELLMSHPRFTMKYTAQIYIPQYTAQELIYFGQIYANAQDYVIGEEGQEALAEKISVAVENGAEVTIKDVIDMVGKAIQRSNRFFRKMKMGKRRYDDNDFIILFGKDFGSVKKN